MTAKHCLGFFRMLFRTHLILIPNLLRLATTKIRCMETLQDYVPLSDATHAASQGNAPNQAGGQGSHTTYMNGSCLWFS